MELLTLRRLPSPSSPQKAWRGRLYLYLAMDGVGAAARAEFLDREFLGLALLVPARRVVTALTAVARKSDKVSHQRLNPKAADAALNHESLKAHDGNRTRDLFLTKEVLYRLSYMGVPCATPSFKSPAVRTARFGAGNGTRTRDPELGRLALYQLSYSRPLVCQLLWWRGEDSNLRRHKPADLQSAPFGHSGTSPNSFTPKPMARIELATY